MCLQAFAIPRAPMPGVVWGGYALLCRDARCKILPVWAITPARACLAHPGIHARVKVTCPQCAPETGLFVPGRGGFVCRPGGVRLRGAQTLG